MSPVDVHKVEVGDVPWEVGDVPCGGRGCPLWRWGMSPVEVEDAYVPCGSTCRGLPHLPWPGHSPRRSPV